MRVSAGSCRIGGCAPLIAGLDKFFHILVNWDQYLALWIANVSPIPVHSLMMLVGAIEIIAGLIFAFRPTGRARQITEYQIDAWIVFARL